MLVLDAEEQEVVTALAANKLIRSPCSLTEIAQHREIAAATLKRDSGFNIYLTDRDMRILQLKAIRDGVEYQILAASILHKFLDGQLIEKGELNAH